MNRSVLLFLSALLLSILFVFGFMLVNLAKPPAPPLHYRSIEYAPARSVYAPGETMVYTPELEVRNAGRVDVLRSFWDVTRDQAATLCSGGSAPIIEVKRNLPAGTVGNVRGGKAVRVSVPMMPPGDYLLISSATGPSGGQSVYQVAFSIDAAC
jgi:hypothetical protein